MYICRDHRPHGAIRRLDENVVVYPCQNCKRLDLTLKWFCIARQNFSIGSSSPGGCRLQLAYSCTCRYLHPCSSLNACVCRENAWYREGPEENENKVDERGRHLAALLVAVVVDSNPLKRWKFLQPERSKIEELSTNANIPNNNRRSGFRPYVDWT
jgi:hypothetical protein